MKTITIHHLTAKKAETNGLVIAVDTDTNQAVVTMAGKEIERGTKGEDPKEVLARAITITSDEDFDIEAFGGEDEDEGEAEGGSIVKPKYRAKYAPFGGDNNGDDFAQAWRTAVHVPDLNKAGEQRFSQKGRAKTRPDHSLADQVLAANGIVTSTLPGRNFGHSVMIGMNMLRGRMRKGQRVVIGDVTFEPDAQVVAAQRAKAQAKIDALKASQAKGKAGKGSAAKTSGTKTERDLAAGKRRPSKAQKQAALGQGTRAA